MTRPTMRASVLAAFAALVSFAAPAAMAQSRDVPAPVDRPPQPDLPVVPRPGEGLTLSLPPLEAFRALQLPPAAPAGQRRVVNLRGLDKVTTRLRELQVPLGTTVRFGTLQVTASECLVNTPEVPPDAVAFLTILDQKPGQTAQKLFSGWMFAASPALSALDHSVYDVWVVACANVAQTSEPPSSR